ncbi:hypothetical protein BP6252_11465 [Coleophoma cylindrospora]|uniref:Zn(2)-C6 fungal-type domain-containing protein n=1 Tax=Coleophoma cylindrospora TaxID=1849047 RepID=A0A3D8QJP1_9HELO|nr:hypothetical protein BP6252_11465 [Coleophoma cylindrospora]
MVELVPEEKSLKRKRDEDDTVQRRTPRACLPCRKRKVKCSGTQPCCENCLRLHDKCHWGTECHKLLTGSGQAPNSAPPVQKFLSRQQHDVLVKIFFNTPHFDILRQCIHRPSFEAKEITAHCPFMLVSIYCISALYVSPEDVREVFHGEEPADLSARLVVLARQWSRDTSDQPCGYKSWMFTGIAIRMTQALRLHREYHQRHSSLEQEVRRRTMWACFIMDRLVAHVTGRPYTFQTKNLSAKLPCAESAFLFEETSSSTSSAATIETGPSPECTEVLPFFIKAVDLWSVMTDLFATGVKSTSTLGAASPNHEFYRAEQELRTWKDNLPARMKWSMKNYRTHRVLGQGSLFVSLHFVLNHAFCVAHQEYLPDANSDMTITSSEMEETPNITAACLYHADEITRMASSLHIGDATDMEMLRAPFVGVALECAACCHLWTIHQESSEADVELTSKATASKQKLRLLCDMLKSWSAVWPIAAAWYETIELLTKLYDAVRPGGSPLIESSSDDAAEDLPPGCTDVALGSGLPDPRNTAYAERLFDQIRHIAMTATETSGLRHRQTRLWIENLWTHTWLKGQPEMSEAAIGKYNTVAGDFSNFENVLDFMDGFEAFDDFTNASYLQGDQPHLLPYPWEIN